jgi:hypothetical protein
MFWCLCRLGLPNTVGVSKMAAYETDQGLGTAMGGKTSYLATDLGR